MIGIIFESREVVLAGGIIFESREVVLTSATTPDVVESRSSVDRVALFFVDSSRILLTASPSIFAHVARLRETNEIAAAEAHISILRSWS